MRLTSFTDYGFRALMRMAADPRRAFSTSELAADLRISRNHLAKVISRLARAGIVSTRRGGAGGVVLARPAGDIRLGEIARVLEAGQALVECFAEDTCACTLIRRCRLKPRLAAAERAFLAELDRSTLADCADLP